MVPVVTKVVVEIVVAAVVVVVVVAYFQNYLDATMNPLVLH